MLAIGVLIARAAYLWLACPYTLVEDEAFYWTWSQRLELSYYSKGPGIAWLIWLSTSIFGDTMFAVRLPAAIVSAATALVLAGFTNDVFRAGAGDGAGRDRRPGFFAACCFLLAPMFQVSSLVMTIDGPYALCWIGATWTAWRAFAPYRESPRASRFVLVAAIVGLGFLIKYTILLLIPGLLVFAWLTRKQRRGTGGENAGTRRNVWMWLGVSALVLAAGLAPVVVWNWQHQWPTVKHLLGHAGLPGGDVVARGGWRYSPLWTLEYVAVQALSVGPSLLLVLIAIVRSRQEWNNDPARRTRDLFLLCCGLPPIVFYFLVTFLTKAQANWALAGYLPLLAFAGTLIASGMDEWRKDVDTWRAKPRATRVREGFFRRQPESLVQFLWNCTVVLGVVIVLGMLRLDIVAAGVDALKKAPLVGAVVPAKASVPLGRFMGADRMGAHAGELLARLARRRQSEPFVLTPHYGRAAHLEFYTTVPTRVYCASAFVPGGRESQYDYWSETALRGATRLLGRDALIVGGYRVEDWQPFFERVELLGTLDGDGKPDRPAFYGFGFRGVEAGLARIREQPSLTPERLKPMPSYPSAPRAIPFEEAKPPGPG